MYETFEHTADLGLRIRATDLPTVYADAARGLFSLIVVRLDAVAERETVTVELSASDPETLLFDWLNELLYIYETRHLVFNRFEIRLLGPTLLATAHGEPLDAARHGLDHEVKAITYHGLKLIREPQGWLAEVIVDI